MRRRQNGSFIRKVQGVSQTAKNEICALCFTEVRREAVVGHHPDLGLDFYTNLFRELKELYPTLKLHALGPPEIAHIAKLI